MEVKPPSLEFSPKPGTFWGVNAYDRLECFTNLGRMEHKEAV
jgi:hypothetical protein